MTKPKKIQPARCPKCGAELSEKEVIKLASPIMGRRGGKIGGKASGACKVRDHKTLSEAAKRRWARWREEKGRPPKN